MYDINAEKAVKKQRLYYHVTSIKNIDQIKKNGLKADKDGLIFVFTNQIVTDEIAVKQLGLTKAALFKIDSQGITGKVVQDRVAEFTASYHRVIIQEKILKRYVHFLRSWTIDEDNPSPWEIFKRQRMRGLSKGEAIAEFYSERKMIEICNKARAAWSQSGEIDRPVISCRIREDGHGGRRYVVLENFDPFKSPFDNKTVTDIVAVYLIHYDDTLELMKSWPKTIER